MCVGGVIIRRFYSEMSLRLSLYNLGVPDVVS